MKMLTEMLENEILQPRLRSSERFEKQSVKNEIEVLTISGKSKTIRRH